MGTSEAEVIDEREVAALQLAQDADVDIQIATAKRFPRSLQQFMRQAQEMATLTPEIAKSCLYALPRDGKVIEGPSARFAEMMACAWKNIRAEGRTIGDDGRFVTSRGTAWDIENNVALAFEVKRRITNSRGQAYSEDMITVTGNAGSSIALRNAILKVIPTAFWKPVYTACRKVVAGDAKTFQSRRDDLLKELAVMGVTEARVCSALGLKGKLDVTLEHMVVLSGFITALRDGDTTVEQAFPESGGLGSPKPAARKSEQAASAQSTNPQPDSASTAAQKPEPPSHVGVIVDVEMRNDLAVVHLDTGYVCGSTETEVIAAAQRAKEAGLRVELSCQEPKDPRFLRRLLEFSIKTDGAPA